MCFPFEAKFDGPYVVQRKVSEENYVIGTPGRRKATKLCHVNLLKPFYENQIGETHSVDLDPVHSILSVG